jgi:outer membrane lipoprotein-sorting protein
MPSIRATAAALLLICLPATAIPAPTPTADELIRRYDDLMSPGASEALMAMIAHRQDGTTRSYKMRVLNAKDDKLRVWFLDPPSTKGQEMLRVGDNQWIYMPNLKRAIRIASRESFQGGDFSNGDVLRVHYRDDYTAKLAPSGDDLLWALDLAAKSEESTYARIKLWMSKEKQLPVRAEYYAVSGKLLRSATFDTLKTFHGVEGPSHITMRNELATKRFSEMFILDRKADIDLPAQTFVLDSVGR